MLDFDIAEMYHVETKNLNLSVKRNIKRFPTDFMFQLSQSEWECLRLQIETSKRGGRRYMPYAFTEQGIAMLSGLLNSDISIEVNINIMRAFVAVRKMLFQPTSPKSIEERMKALEIANEELLKDLNDLSEETRSSLDDIYFALAEMAAKQKSIDKPRNPIGFKK